MRRAVLRLARAAALLLASSLTACQGTATQAAGRETITPPRTTMNTATPAPTVRTLVVSRPKEGRLGSLAFDQNNEVRLVAEGSGPAVEALKQAWQEMSAQPKLSWVKTVVEESGGKKITAIESEEYGRKDANYFYAVLDTLSRQYGFSVDIAK